MITFIITYLLLQTQIDPTAAVENVGTNYGLLGSLFVIVLALLVGALIHIKKTSKQQFEYLNLRLDKAEKEAEEARDELKVSQQNHLNYIKDKNDFFADIIKNNTDSRDTYRLIIEKFLATG